ncbi:MAG: EamA family transporter [Candidatus Pacebacteria bacterium]|nr:EamA family transporter [Candidatus Paceibacterota bacterium]
MAKKKTTVRLKSYFLLIINTLVWGASLIIVKPALEFTSPFRYLFYRYIGAVVFSLPILWYYWPKINQKTQQILTISKIELVGTTLALSLLYFGLAKTSAIEASLLTTTAPIFAIVAGIALLKEREEKHEFFGLILAFCGTILLTVLPVLNGFAQQQGISLTGNLLIIGQNISTAVYFVWAKKAYRNLPKLFVTTISFYVGLTSFMILSFSEAEFSITKLINQVSLDLQHWQVWLAGLYMALFGSIIGLTAYIKGQDGIEVSEASLFWYLQPLVYIPLGMFFLQETVNWLQGLALALILGGVILAEQRRRR